MVSKAHVRVVMSEDGKTPDYQLMSEGYKICDLTYMEVMELALNATSALRWWPRHDAPKR
jgi:hypothetical protein